MRKFVFSLGLFFAVLLSCGYQALAQTPTVETFKQVMTKRLQKLVIGGTTQRDVRFVSVQAGRAKDGAYPFRATIVVRDYGTGYPANHYYGQTCVGKLEDQDYYMLPDDFGGWKVEGVMTPPLSSQTCKNNPAAGVSSISAEGLEGAPAAAGTPVPLAVASRMTSARTRGTGNAGGGSLTTGEWACYGSGGRALIGLGFKVYAGGTYTDLDNKSRGTYVFTGSTITFNGGHLAGQVAHSVGGGRFNIGTTTCEHNR
ncbi:MAG: hypothetical protein PHX83_03790 [Acidobacteriia bacterium]|nr:hypothetical protein [Terriglobia bacterium]